MASSLFLKNKQFLQISVNVDLVAGLSESMFWFSDNWTDFTSTRSLSRIPLKGLYPTFHMIEQDYLEEGKLYFVPAWGSRSTKSLQENGKTFKSTLNYNDGFIANVLSDENKALEGPVELVGLSVQPLATKSFAVLGNMEDFSVSFYASSTDWLLGNPLETFNNPERTSDGRWDFDAELRFKVVSIIVRSLNVAKQMPKITLARPANFYELSSEEEMLSLNFDQEVKGEDFATGLALKTCDFSFIDLKGIFDKNNPDSPFYQMDLRNFLMTPRIDYFRDGRFNELIASYTLGQFYGDPIETSGNDKTTKLKGTTKLGQLKALKTSRHYYIKSTLSEVLKDLFTDLGAVISVEASLDEEVILYQFFGGETLENTLKLLCEKYRLIICETADSQLLARRIQSSSIKTPQAYFDLSNEFKYTPNQTDKVVNKLTVKQNDYTLSDEGLEKYWLASLLPVFEAGGDISLKTVAIEKDGTTEEIQVLDLTQSILELPKLLDYDSTKIKVYNARNPHTNKPEPTLEYQVVLKETFNPERPTYLSDVILSKDNNTDSQASYLEFEWFSEDCFYESVPSTLLSIKVWAYAEACYEFVEYKRTYGDNLEYDENGYAIIVKANKYRGGEENQSLFFGEAQIVPPLENRGKLLKTESITLKSSRGRIKEISDETKEKADVLEFEATAGQVWDKIESDLIRPEDSESWLWVEETFSQDKVKVRYLNISSSQKSYDIRVYGREFVKVERASDVYPNEESQAIYGEKEGEVENLDLEQIDAYLKLHAKPWETVSLEVQGNPVVSVGDIIQHVSEYQILGRGQVTKNTLKVDSNSVMTSQITAIGLPVNKVRPLGAGGMGVVGEMMLG